MAPKKSIRADDIPTPLSRPPALRRGGTKTYMYRQKLADAYLRQIGTSIGIFFGYVCWFVVDHYLGGTKQSPEIRWKIQSALPLVTTIPLIFTAYMVPESYIYLLKTRKYKKAMESA